MVIAGFRLNPAIKLQQLLSMQTTAASQDVVNRLFGWGILPAWEDVIQRLHLSLHS